MSHFTGIHFHKEEDVDVADTSMFKEMRSSKIKGKYASQVVCDYTDCSYTQSSLRAGSVCHWEKHEYRKNDPTRKEDAMVRRDWMGVKKTGCKKDKQNVKRRMVNDEMDGR